MGCSGRRKEIEDYERDVCACKDEQCIIAALAKHRVTTRSPTSWFERHFVSSSAERAMREAMQRAEKCTSVYRSSDYHCGGEAGEACPPGYRCEGIDESIPDGQGDCFRIPNYVAKSGKPCGGPDHIECEPGSTCTKTYQGEAPVFRCVGPGAAASSAAVEGRSCTIQGGVDDCGPGFFCMTTMVGSITSIGTCMKGEKGIGGLGGSGSASPSSSASSSVPKP
jgi:hypothetical protein